MRSTGYVDQTTLNEYEEFVSSHRKGHFMQSRMWGRVKSSWQWHGIYTKDESGKITGALSVLVRRLPGLPYRLMYGCRGPVCDLADRETLLALIFAAKELARRERCYLIKLDPDVGPCSMDFLSVLTEQGFRHTGTDKNFEGIQPRFVFRLDLSGKSEQDLLDGFESKTRYNLRLAVRKGVEVRVCGEEMLDDFTRLMEETGNRDRFIVRTKNYFKKMLDSLGEHARLYMAFYNGHPVAGTLAIRYGDKVWYLYGASSNDYRNVMPNYLLQWEMIRWALQSGCRVYDFRGISGDLSEDNPLYGLYRFKKGFGGDFTEFAGEYDCIIKPFVYFTVKNGRKLYGWFHYRLTMIRNRLRAKKQADG